MTVEPGRLLSDRTAVVQDGTGGIAVRLPLGTRPADLPRGRIVQLTGRLAAPYANMELRVDRPGDIVTIGSGGLPEPIALASGRLDEASEGILARVAGSIERVESGSSGSLAVTVRDDHGAVRVFVHAGLGIGRSRFPIGDHLVAVGIVGQRESASGLGDGYRLWPRDPADLTIQPVPRATPTPRPGATPSPRASATPRPSASPRPSPTPRATRPGDRVVIRIAAARPGQTVTVEGVVTTPVGLLDSDARRVTLQDGSGAILLRLPEGAAVPRVGARLQVTGDVATYYGAPQLEAAEVPTQLGQERALPVVLRRAPGATDEWKLVRVTVRIVNVSRSGDTWRAEVSLGAAGALPIVGLADSDIPSTALEEGRSATITGIVKRAYPTASDQRFSVVPRGKSDVELGAAPNATRTPVPGDGQGPGATPTPATAGDSSGLDPTPDPITGTSPGGAAPGEVPIEARLAAVPGLAGRVVRVAGALGALDGPLLTLDDGSGTALVRIVEPPPGVDPPPGFDPPLIVGEVLNVTGRVSARDVGGWEIVTRRAEVLRAASLAASTPLPTDATGTGTATPGASPEPDAGLAPGGDPPPVDPQPADPGRLALALGFGTLVALMLILLGTLLVRRAPRSRRVRLTAARPDSEVTAGPPAVTPTEAPLDAHR